MQPSIHPQLVLETAFSQVIESLGLSIDEEQLRLQQPAQSDHGEYASSCALHLFSQLKNASDDRFASPRELAENIVAELNTYFKNQEIELFDAFSVAGPGFINCTLASSALVQHAAELASMPLTEFSVHPQEKQRVLLEYVGPNTNKPLHIGHLRNAALGVAMCRLWERSRHEVNRATIYNDRGLHITKSMWAYLYFAAQPARDFQKQTWQEVLAVWLGDNSSWLKPEDMEDARLKKPDHFVGHWYQQADALADDAAVQEVWSAMLQAWENELDSQHQAVRTLWSWLNDYFYQGFAETTERLGVFFDDAHISHESAIYQAGKKIVQDGARAGTFEQLDDGAIRAHLEDRFNLPNKILLRKDGTGIYMTFDIELARQRSETGVDRLLWLVGQDQELYFQQLFAICEMLGYGTRDRYRHFAYGMVRLPEGNMSSRKGRVVYADQLLDLAVEKAREIMTETQVAKDLSAEEAAAVAEAVGVGAVQWTMLGQEPVSEMTFDITKSVSFKGFAGPYIQYTVARCASVVRQAEQISTIDYETFRDSAKPFDIEIETSEKEVLRNLTIYIDVVERSTAQDAPQLLTTYLHTLAQSFNGFYAEVRIVNDLGSKDAGAREAAQRRVMMTTAVQKVLRDGLGLLGIEAPRKM
ncbi:MAG: arginine--tRNA ligase [Patescibacteria group bacterium]